MWDQLFGDGEERTWARVRPLFVPTVSVVAIWDLTGMANADGGVKQLHDWERGARRLGRGRMVLGGLGVRRAAARVGRVHPHRAAEAGRGVPGGAHAPAPRRCVTNALVYIFAFAALLLLIWFVLALALSWRHADRRNTRSKKLKTDDPDGTVTASAMHLTIGDLVRDGKLAAAARRGMTVRGQMLATSAVRSAEPEAGGARATVVLKRNVRDQFYFDVRAPDGTLIATSEAHDSKEAALAAVALLSAGSDGALLDET